MPVDVEQLHLQIQQRLIETGEWERWASMAWGRRSCSEPRGSRIKSNFKAKLDETGWTDEFRDKSKGKKPMSLSSTDI